MSSDPASLAVLQEQFSGFLQQTLLPQTERQFELLLQLGGVIAGAFTAILVGLLAYVVARQQAESARTTKEIERQRLLHEIEGSLSRLTSTPAVWTQGRSKFESKVPQRFIVALTKEFCWDALGEGPQHIWMDSDRLLVFTKDRSLLNSTVLHEFLFWFRRVARAHAAGLINDGDLSGLWRQTLPFAADLRYSFLAQYFGRRNGGNDCDDIAAITLVLQRTIRCCVKNDYHAALNYLSERLDPKLECKLDAKLVASIRQRGRGSPHSHGDESAP